MQNDMILIMKSTVCTYRVYIIIRFPLLRVLVVKISYTGYLYRLYYITLKGRF